MCKNRSFVCNGQAARRGACGMFVLTGSPQLNHHDDRRRDRDGDADRHRELEAADELIADSFRGERGGTRVRALRRGLSKPSDGWGAAAGAA